VQYNKSSGLKKLFNAVDLRLVGLGVAGLLADKLLRLGI
jgi:hypothetical protein